MGSLNQVPQDINEYGKANQTTAKIDVFVDATIYDKGSVQTGNLYGWQASDRHWIVEECRNYIPPIFFECLTCPLTERMNDTALRKEVRRNRYFMDQIRIKELMATNAIEQEMRETYGFREFCVHYVLRHRNHDWGDLCDEDWKQNDWAVEHEERLLSAYDIPKALCIGYESKIWIITETDRSVTTILFPSDY